jgi:uncharacterized protein (DUF58 family)
MHVLGRLLDPQLVESLNHLAMGARRVVEGNTIGLHRSPIKGASVEFRQHRLYVPGDEPRRIDWRVLARSDRAFVKEFDEETNLRATIFLDASGSMAYGKPNKFDYAVRLVAGLTYLMLAQTESAGLVIASAKDSADDFLAPSSASTQLARIVDLLERAAPDGATTLDQTLLRSADRMDRRSLVIVVSDFLLPVESLRRGIARLAHDRHELVLVRLLHPDEQTFPFQSWARFRGYEGETPRLIEGPQVRKLYLANFKRHEDELQQMCRRVKADLLVCPTDQSLLDSVMSVVRRRACS